MKSFSLFIALSILLSSCATTLNSKYQKVSITKSSNANIKINGDSPNLKNGKYLLKRDLTSKQITIEREGYKNEHIVVVPYKKSPLYALSWVPFGILIMPPLLDIGIKTYDHDKIISARNKTAPIPSKPYGSKNISIKNVGLDLGDNTINFRSFGSYRSFIRKESKTKTEETQISNANEKIKLENTIFAEPLQSLLKKHGYVDTTKRVLKNSFINNVYLSSTIKDITLHTVGSSFMYVDLRVSWELFNYYDESIYKQLAGLTSGQFKISGYDFQTPFKLAVKDAMEIGVIEFLNNSEIQRILKEKELEDKEKSFDAITIQNGSKYVTTLGGAIKSSVTISSDLGHGSGFIISDNGYIITNYHVVSNNSTSNSKVILNDGSEFKFKLVRSSKIHDLALIKIEADGLIPFKLSDDYNIEIAKDVYAVGTPNAQDLSQTISKGIISGERKTDMNSKLIQTDASINAGNSGGAIVDTNGVVLGVVSSKLSGFGIEGVAFGIPAYEIFDRLKIEIK